MGRADGLLRGQILKGYELGPGRTDAHLLELTVFDLQAVRRNSGCTCLLVERSVAWGPSSTTEQPALVGAIATDPALCVVDILVDGPRADVRATAEELLDWNSSYRQSYPIALANIMTYAFLPQSNELPDRTIVRPSTMKILGTQMGQSPDFIKQARLVCSGP